MKRIVVTAHEMPEACVVSPILTSRIRRAVMLTVAVLLMAGASLPVRGGPYDTWSRRLSIRCAAEIPGTLTNFPVLIVLNTNDIVGFSYSDFNSPADGADLRFAADDGETSLSYEIDEWNTNGSSYVWVQVPEIAGTNAVIHAYWGMDADTPVYATNGAVWANGFHGVWHLNETGGTFADSTTNRNHATIAGSVQQGGEGRIGAAIDTTSGYLITGNNLGITGNAPRTIAIWFKQDSASRKAVAGFGIQAHSSMFDVLLLGGVMAHFHGVNTDGYPYTVGIWQQATITYDGLTLKIFINGTLHYQGNWTLTTGDAPLFIGAGKFDPSLNGMVDEVQISSVARSSNWIYAAWLNQASNDVFLSYSEAQQQATNLSVSAQSAANIGATSATLRGTVLHAGNAENPDVYVCWGAVDGLTNATTDWEHVIAMGADWGAGASFSTNITGLVSGSTYVYRAYVTNTTGEAWSDAVLFTAAYLPAIVNDGADWVHRHEARLLGRVTDSGADPPWVWLEYWPDAGVSTSTVPVGILGEQPFAAMATDLTENMWYHFRFGASNAAGVVWSDTDLFLAAAAPLVWSGGGPDHLAGTGANWTPAIAPTNVFDSVILNHTSAKDMTWDLTNSVASWIQTEDYIGTVAVSSRFDDDSLDLKVTGNVTVSGGTWTHQANPPGNTEVYRLRARIGGDFTLGPAARLEVRAKGFAGHHWGGYGPGAFGTGNANYSRGSSHGGLGGQGSDGAVNPWDKVYGSITAPTNLGSSSAYPGGGAIYLTVDGTATLDGEMDARGYGAGSYVSDSAGGSIYIVAGALLGDGTLDASGGVAGGGGGSGGGGRVAVILTNGADFASVTMKAHGGGTVWNVDVAASAAGTVYRQTVAQADGEGTLVIDNDGIATGPAMTIVPPTITDLNIFEEIILTNRGFLALNTNTALDWIGRANMAVYGPQQSLLMIQNTNGVTIPEMAEFSDFSLYAFTNLVFSGNLTLSNAAVVMASSHYPSLAVAGDLGLSDGSTISHWHGSESLRLTIAVGGNLWIDDGSQMSADGKGFPPGAGPGAGSAANANTAPAASHGGQGAPNPGLPGQPATYGSILAPVRFGSGAYSYGGGAIQATVTGTTTLHGAIFARAGVPGLAAAAGGSIYLTTGMLEGNGVLDVSSPDFSPSSAQYGGGGGRIAVILTEGQSFDVVEMKAYGCYTGRPDPFPGAAGTVYRQTASQSGGRGVLTIDNRSVITATGVTTELPWTIPPTPADDLSFVTLAVTNGARVSLTGDIVMGNLFLQCPNARLHLNGYTLNLKSVYHHEWGSPAQVIYDGGQILWTIPGTIIKIR